MPARNYSSTAAEISLFSPASSSATTIVLDTTAGLPDPPFTLVLDAGSAGEEIVNVSALDGTSATVDRGVDGTIAVSHNLGAEVRHMMSARDLQEPQDHMYATTGVHGREGALVGTTDTQVLTNKSISGSDNTLSNIPSSAIESLDGAKLTGVVDATTVGGVRVTPSSTPPDSPNVGDVWIPLA